MADRRRVCVISACLTCIFSLSLPSNRCGDDTCSSAYILTRPELITGPGSVMLCAGRNAAGLRTSPPNITTTHPPKYGLYVLQAAGDRAPAS